MAKYKLKNALAGGHRDVPCSVLHESAGDYVVQFKNGVVRRVPANSVYHLDKLDEGVIDSIRRFGSNLFGKLRKVGNAVATFFGNTVLPAVSPINTMNAASEIEGMSFFPSDSLIKIGEEAGIPVKEVVGEEVTPDAEYNGELAAVWEDMFHYQDAANMTDESLNRPFVTNKALFERSFEEVNAEIKDKLSDGVMHNITYAELAYELTSQMLAYIDGDKETEVNPILIWGAPGIGKTDVIRQLYEDVKEACNGSYSVSQMNLNGALKNDLSLPYFVKDDGGMIVGVEDYPKSWIPCYKVLTSSKELPKEYQKLIEDGVISEVDMLKNWNACANNTCNSGSGKLDKNTGEYTEEISGQGGVLFIDEVSRVDKGVMNILMSIILDRKYNGNVIGSKWMFVFAANRYYDMIKKGSRHQTVNFAWEDAWTQRFTNYNYIPDVASWLKWARKSGQPATLIKFIKANPEYWFKVVSLEPMAGDGDDKDVVRRWNDKFMNLYPNPRNDAQVGKRINKEVADAERYRRCLEIIEKNGGDENALRKESPLDYVFYNKIKALPMSRREELLKTFSDKDVSADRYEDIAGTYIGHAAGRKVSQYIGFDSKFSDVDGKSAWYGSPVVEDETGERVIDDTIHYITPADMDFKFEGTQADMIIDTITRNYPFIPKNGKNVVTLDMYQNLMAYIIILIDTLGRSANKAGLAKNMVQRLNSNLIVSPFDMSGIGQDAIDSFEKFVVSSASKDAGKKSDSYYRKIFAETRNIE